MDSRSPALAPCAPPVGFLSALAILFLFLLFGPLSLPAQEEGPLVPPPNPQLDRFTASLEQVRRIIQTAISPDGNQVAWVLAQDGGAEIDVISISSPGSPQRITAGDGTACIEENPVWAPDSRELAFTSNCRNNSQLDLYLATIPAGHSPISVPRRLTRLHGALSSPAFSPDGLQIGFLYVVNATRRPGALDAMKPPAGVIGIESSEVQQVAAVDLRTGETKTLTPNNLYVYEFDLSPNGRQLTYSAAPLPGEDNWWVAKLYIQDIFFVDGKNICKSGRETHCGAPRPIFDPGSRPGPLHGMQIAVPRWSPNGRKIAFIAGLMSDQGSTGGEIYQVDSSGSGTPVDLTPDWHSTAVWFSWVGEDRLIISSIVGGSTHIEELHLSGTADQEDQRDQGDQGVDSKATAITLMQADASLGDGRREGSLSISAAGDRYSFIRSSFAQPPEAYAGPLTGEGPQQITHDNDGLQPSWGRAQSIDWTSDSFQVQGWLLYPANYDPSEKYPLIVSVHGGPSGAVLPTWPSPGYNPIAFSAFGYFVLMPNPRGSFGQGEAFTRANRRDFGYGDLRDILRGVDRVSAAFPIDPQRIGITGWSYGGFMTMFAVTQTQRFRAAVAGAGISNWQSYYGENSIDQWMLPFFGVSVYDDPAVYAKSSAINFIRDVKTPTLLVVGDRDGECPAPQSFEFWHALRSRGVPTRLVVYPNEGHGFSSAEDRQDVLARALAWFDRYMPDQKPKTAPIGR